MAEMPIECRSTDDLDLEAVVVEPDTPGRVLVFCHPHPQMGGTMNAPLLLAVQERLVSDGWAVLRFNFRGIGRSEGESSDGRAEVADACGAVDTARERWPDLPLAIAGWSFGGAVAIRVALTEPAVSACVAIAPAVVPKPGITAGTPSPEEVSLERPLLIVCGSNDKQVSTADVRRWAEAVGADYEEVPGANHFFWAKYDELSSLIARWLDERVGDAV
jgi:uncharacterized protein